MGGLAGFSVKLQNVQTDRTDHNMAVSAVTSEEIVGHWLLGGDASGLLWSSFKDDELPLKMLIQLQDGSNVSTSEKTMNLLAVSSS